MAAHHLSVLVQHLRKLASTRRAKEATDQQLLQRFVIAREEAAFTTLVQRHGPMVLGVCQRVLHQWQDAEDAFQATFLVLVRQASSIRKQESVGSWLYRVAYRVARKARASAGQRAAAERQVEPRQPSDPDSAFLWRELRPLLDEELDRLPEKYRAPVVLCYLEGKTYGEAARQLGWTKGTLSGRLAQARHLLQQRLTRRGLTLSAGFLGMLQAANTSPAAVPPALVEATTRAALLVLAGKAAGVLSAPITALAEGVLDAMVYSPWKAAAPWLLAVVVFGTGAGLLTYQARATRLAEAWREGGRQAAAQGKDLPKSEGGKKERVDHDGEPLPPDAIARLGTGRFRHGWRVVKAAFSPDGTVLATSGSGRGWLCFWDAASGKELRRWPADGNPDSVLAFSPDFKLVAANNTWEPGAAKLCLFDIATGKEVHRLLGRPKQTTCVAFSPDGKVLASGGEDETMHTIHLWEVATGRELRLFQGHQERINTIAFSRDGKLLVSGSADKTIRLWDAALGTELGRLTEHQASVWSVAFSPDGLLLASSSEDKTIRLWDITNRRQVRVLGGDRASIASVVFSPDGKLLASGTLWDKAIALWDVARAQEVRRWRTQDYVGSLAFSPDGRSLVSTSATGSAPQFWDPATGEEIRPPRGHRSSVDWLAFSPDGTMLFSGGREQVLLRWDLATGQERLVFASPLEESFARIILSPEGKVAATWSRSRTEPSIRLWDPVTGKELRMLGKHAWESDRMVAPWQALAFSTDGQRLVTVDRERLVLWDPASGRQVREFLGLKGVIACVALSPDGRLVAGGAQGQDGWTLVLWDLATGEQLRVVECRDGVLSLVFSPDSKRFATANGEDGPVRLWDVTTGKELYSLTRPAKGFNALAYSPNGRLLAGTGTASPNRVYLWETLTGQEIRQFTSRKDEALSLAFAPDGKTLASGNGEGTILLWDVTGRWQDGPSPTNPLRANGQDQFWTDLGGEAATAYRAIAALVAAPQQAVPLLRERLRPVAPVDPQRMTQLIAALDSHQFAVRQKATEDLEKLAELAEPALRKALAGQPPTLELRQRLELLLQKMEEPMRSPDTLRALRGLEVLEHIGTPEARQALKALAQGTVEARLTQEAKAALDRLARRPRTTR